MPYKGLKFQCLPHRKHVFITRNDLINDGKRKAAPVLIGTGLYAGLW
jgi:hypothetical protein